eukprot:jgi/Mesvir1/26216/Mv02399-RA.1
MNSHGLTTEPPEEIRIHHARPEHQRSHFEELTAPLLSVRHTVDQDEEEHCEVVCLPLKDGASTYASATCTLSLFLVGSAVLPIPYAFSVTGVLLGILTTAAICWANLYSSELLIPYADEQHRLLEDVAEKAGGRTLKLITQVSLLILLYGSLCANMSITSDLALVATQSLVPLDSPFRPLLLGDPESGDRLLILGTVFILLPLCLPKRIDSSRFSGAAGAFVLLAIAGTVVSSSVSHGLPGLHTPGGAWWRVSRNFPSAAAIIGYSSYMQPVVLPMLREMAPGKEGRSALVAAMRTAMVFSAFIYLLVGIFGFLDFGADARGDVLSMYTGTWPMILDAVTALYLMACFPTVLFSVRLTIDEIIAGANAEFSWARHVVETIALLLASLSVALVISDVASVFTFTGATGAVIVCYVLPIVIHLRLRPPPAKEPDAWLLRRAAGWMGHYAWPWAIMGVGTAISIGSLYVGGMG